MARRGKFARLVDDFVATVGELGGSVDPAVVAAELQARIDAIAAQLHVTPQTVLRTPAMDLRQAAEAVSGLGLAIHEAPPDGQIVTVGADVVAWTRTTLRVFRDQLGAGTWSSCPCGEQHGQHDTDAAVLAAVNNDLLLLPMPGPDNGEVARNPGAED